MAKPLRARTPPVGTQQCFPSTSNDPNRRGLYQWDGQYWQYLRDIDRSECPRVRLMRLATTRIVTSYVANNSIPAAELPSLLAAVDDAISNTARATKTKALPTPAVPIKRSVTPDAIFSLENGKPYRTLTRHLSTKGLTPENYRAKWGLPSTYPMVAPNYAKRRSELAVKLGLGRKPAPKPPTKPLSGRARKPKP